MTFSIIILGVLIILTAFNVGESIWNKFGLSKKWLLISLISIAILYFVPNITINGVSFSIVGFIIPTILSVFIIIKTRGAKNFFKMFVAMLIAFSLGILYNLITFDVYESNIFQPYLVLAILIGSLTMLVEGDPRRLFASNAIGIILSEIAFYFSRYSIYGNYYLTIGSEKVIAVLLLSLATSVFIYFVYRKTKAKVLKRKLEKQRSEKILA